MSSILAVTGHRPNKLTAPGLRDWVREQLKSSLRELAPAKAISGMAVGVDQDFAEVCVELEVPFTAAVPFVGQEGRWPRDVQLHYRKLLKQATEVVYVCEPGYAPWKMHIRNAWMVDSATHILAVFDGTPGGTAHTFNYATRMKKPITRINPADFILERSA